MGHCIEILYCAGISNGWLKIKTLVIPSSTHCMLFPLQSRQLKPLKWRVRPRTLMMEGWRRKIFLILEGTQSFKVMYEKDCRYFYSHQTCMIQKRSLTWLKDQSCGWKRSIEALFLFDYSEPYDLLLLVLRAFDWLVAVSSYLFAVRTSMDYIVPFRWQNDKSFSPVDDLSFCFIWQAILYRKLGQETLVLQILAL